MSTEQEYRNIIMVGGDGDGLTMTVPRVFPIQYAQDEEGMLLYVNSGNVDEQGREIWVPLESTEDPK